MGLVARPVFDLLYSSFQERRISCDILNGKAQLLAMSAGELPGRRSALLDEAAIAAGKSRKSGYNSHHGPIPGTIKQREVYHEPS